MARVDSIQAGNEEGTSGGLGGCFDGSQVGQTRFARETDSPSVVPRVGRIS